MCLKQAAVQNRKICNRQKQRTCIHMYTGMLKHVLNFLSLILAEKSYLESIPHSWHLTLKTAFHRKQLELEVIKHRAWPEYILHSGLMRLVFHLEGEWLSL